MAACGVSDPDAVRIAVQRVLAPVSDASTIAATETVKKEKTAELGMQMPASSQMQVPV
jgi:hypothetical protein